MPLALQGFGVNPLFDPMLRKHHNLLNKTQSLGVSVRNRQSVVSSVSGVDVMQKIMLNWLKYITFRSNVLKFLEECHGRPFSQKL